MTKLATTTTTKTLLFISLFISISLTSSRAQASSDPTFTYETQIPAPSSGSSCDQEAQSLGQRFASVTGRKVTAAQCQQVVNFQADGATQTVFLLSVNYSGVNQLYPVATLLGYIDVSNMPSDYTGIYSSYADCLADMSAQESLYTLNTELPVVSAYCQAGTSPESASYFLRIESFGALKRNLFVDTINLPGPDASATIEEAVQIFTSLPDVHIAKRVANTLLYYSESLTDFSHNSLDLFDDASQCTAQLPEVQTMYNNLGKDVGNKNFLAKCLPVGGESQSVSLEVFYVSPGYVMGGPAYNSPNYFTFDECMANRDAIVTQLQKNNSQVLGALCHKADGTQVFQLDVFNSL